MINNSQRQTGSALVIIIIILAILAVASVGYVFYQNFIGKDKQSTQATNSTDNSDQQKNASPKKEFHSQEHNITFDYPSGWSVVEEVQEGNTSEWYASSVKVLNDKGETVALLSTGGQIGGLCDENAPFVSTSTIIKDSLELKGIGHINFGYTIVESSKDSYGVAFGLLKDDLALGDNSVQCPGMSINYRYYLSSQNTALGGVGFGLWYAESQNADDPNKHQIFKSFDEAKTYSQSDEFKQVKSTIESLSIDV
jgi:hypothetical protein